jgi:hypothetical protein
MKKATTTMNKSRGSKEAKGGDSPAQLDARIEELGDWRGDTLLGSELSSSRPTPKWSRSGSGEWFRCGRTPE